MNFVYLVKVLGHNTLDHDPRVFGIWTTRSAALNAARKWRTHRDDDWTIEEIGLDQEDDGRGIWDCYTDDFRPEGCLQVYARYWPNGFPPLPEGSAATL